MLGDLDETCAEACLSVEQTCYRSSNFKSDELLPGKKEMSFIIRNAGSKVGNALGEASAHRESRTLLTKRIFGKVRGLIKKISPRRRKKKEKTKKSSRRRRRKNKKTKKSSRRRKSPATKKFSLSKPKFAQKFGDPQLECKNWVTSCTSESPTFNKAKDQCVMCGGGTLMLIFFTFLLHSLPAAAFSFATALHLCCP